MCGIVGYTGKQSVAKQILDALELLEYRGYDSAGMAIVDETNGQVQIRKRAGRVADLEKVWKANPVNGICGIGHTRWATHGGVSDVNAHPHRAGRVTLVHNGIIENYEELKDHFGLADELISDTDSEVVAAVLNRFYTGDPHEALFQTVKCLKGTFALVVIFDDIPDVIFAIRNVSPIVAAYREDGTMLASDVAALGGQATSYMVVPEYHVVELHTDDIRVYNMKNELCEAEFLDIDWDTTRAGKGNYPFYMEKEIMEQPEAIKANVTGMEDIQKLFKETIAEFMEDSLDAELEETLGYGKYDHTARTESGTTNSRNGHSRKTLKTSAGKIDINIPRDRNGEFEPRILPKNQTSVSTAIESKIISMYAKGMTTSDIQYHIKDIYDMDISDTTVSRLECNLETTTEA